MQVRLIIIITTISTSITTITTIITKIAITLKNRKYEARMAVVMKMIPSKATATHVRLLSSLPLLLDLGVFVFV